MLVISPPQNNIDVHLKLPGSKSISNRLLILNAIPGMRLKMINLSASDDTAVLRQALETVKTEKRARIDVGLAGTDMRFLTALLSATTGEWELTGTERMKERPIGPLVDSLRSMGAAITYAGKEGFPPLKINGRQLRGGLANVEVNTSSQFVSALLLISPLLKEDLTLKFIGTPVSGSYVDMTLGLMRELGIQYEKGEGVITVKAGSGLSGDTVCNIESDWSCASYWYGICALSPGSSISLSTLHKKSLQPDSVLPLLYHQLGVHSSFSEGKVHLKNTGGVKEEFSYNFIECPDIAQTIAVTCFGLGIPAGLRGLQTLRLKETDRINAMKTELEKLGAKVNASSNELILAKRDGINNPAAIKSYGDHRMALSFATLSCVCGPLRISSPESVNKSYPSFWKHLQSAGFDVNLRP